MSEHRFYRINYDIEKNKLVTSLTGSILMNSSTILTFIYDKENDIIDFTNIVDVVKDRYGAFKEYCDD